MAQIKRRDTLQYPTIDRSTVETDQLANTFQWISSWLYHSFVMETTKFLREDLKFDHFKEGDSVTVSVALDVHGYYLPVDCNPRQGAYHFILTFFKVGDGPNHKIIVEDQIPPYEPDSVNLSIYAQNTTMAKTLLSLVANEFEKYTSCKRGSVFLSAKIFPFHHIQDARDGLFNATKVFWMRMDQELRDRIYNKVSCFEPSIIGPSSPLNIYAKLLVRPAINWTSTYSMSTDIMKRLETDIVIIPYPNQINTKNSLHFTRKVPDLTEIDGPTFDGRFLFKLPITAMADLYLNMAYDWNALHRAFREAGLPTLDKSKRG